MKLRASKLEKTVADHRDEIAKTIAEILEKRLTLKEHVEETEDVSQKSSMELVPVTKEMIVCTLFTEFVWREAMPIASFYFLIIRKNGQRNNPIFYESLQIQFELKLIYYFIFRYMKGISVASMNVICNHYGILQFFFETKSF